MYCGRYSCKPWTFPPSLTGTDLPYNPNCTVALKDAKFLYCYDAPFPYQSWPVLVCVCVCLRVCACAGCVLGQTLYYWAVASTGASILELSLWVNPPPPRCVWGPKVRLRVLVITTWNCHEVDRRERGKKTESRQCLSACFYFQVSKS